MEKNGASVWLMTPLPKGSGVFMLMSYLLRHDLTNKALTHLLEMSYIMYPKNFGSSAEFKVPFYCEGYLKCL